MTDRTFALAEEIERTNLRRHAVPTDRAGATAPSRAACRWLLLLGLGIVAEYAAFTAAFLFRSGPQDADQYLVFHGLQYWNAALFGIAKGWTPLLCSGLSMAGEPQIPFMSLSMALSYALGPLFGVKFAIVAYLLVGTVGAYLYASLWLTMTGQRLLAAALFIGNGFFFCRLGMGHFDFVPFLILPLVLWLLHRSVEWQRQAPSISTLARLAMASWGTGALIALAIDGSPVAIIHLLLWVGLYALSLSWTARQAMPVVSFGCAVLLAAVLDAGYLWPMLQAQVIFPRMTADQFTNPLSFIWFALLPVRGKVLPANGNGHELSVFIGPLLALCIWRYRAWITATLPVAMKRPLLVVGIVSLVLGMGSLSNLHIPHFLSPFDLLRPLPGFRSIGVTGRYWGFLALPLSLLSAAALWKYCIESAGGWRLHAFLGCVVIFQLGFQAETLTRHWLQSPAYRLPTRGAYFRHGPESIDYVAAAEGHQQGEYVTPTRAVTNCYDMDDFNRAQRRPGTGLIDRVMQDATADSNVQTSGQFVTWNQIQLATPCAVSRGSASCIAAGTNRIQWTLGQAYHPGWSAASCNLGSSPTGTLMVDCPASRVREGPIDLEFRDPTSKFAAHISSVTWELWVCITACGIGLWANYQLRMRRSAAIATRPSSRLPA